MEIGKKHEVKIQNMKNKLTTAEHRRPDVPSTWDMKTQQWIKLVAAGDGHQVRQQDPPTYGDIIPLLGEDD